MIHPLPPPIISVAGRVGNIVLQPGDISGLLATLALKAPTANPGLTGVPTAPLAAPGSNNSQIATTAFVIANSNLNVDGGEP